MDEWTDGWMDLDGMFLRGRRLRMEGKGGVWYFGRGEWANLIPLWCFEPCAPFFLRLVFMFRLWDYFFLVS